MAPQSVAKETNPDPTIDSLRYEPDAYERIAIRVRGLQSIAVIAGSELEDNTIAPKVWDNLLHFLAAVADDIEQDAELLWRHTAKGA